MPHENYLAPGGVTGNSALSYTLPNVRTVAHRLETTPFKPSWIRTPGRLVLWDILLLVAAALMALLLRDLAS